MNKLSSDSRARIISALIEGNSIASTCRMTGAAKMTVLSLIREVGTACASFHDAVVCDLATERVQADEVWSFYSMKQKNVPAELQDTVGIGSIWTWTALDADSKLMISWLASNRSAEAANALLADLPVPHYEPPSNLLRWSGVLHRCCPAELPSQRCDSRPSRENLRNQ